jgi:hypothetical protein
MTRDRDKAKLTLLSGEVYLGEWQNDKRYTRRLREVDLVQKRSPLGKKAECQKT